MTDMTEVPRGAIVVGVDATEAAFQALTWAIGEAQTRRAPLALVHGAGTAVTSRLALEHIGLRAVVDAMTTAGKQLLGRAADQVAASAPGLEVHQVLRMTSPRQALMDLADRAAMIVVGPRSDRCPESALLDATRVECPVVVPRTRTTAGCGVVVLCDGSPASRSTLAYAGDQAQRLSLPLCVVHCLPDPPAVLGQQDLTLTNAAARLEAGLGPALIGFERRLLADLVSEMRPLWPGIEVRLVVDDREVDDCLMRAGRSANLLVAGASHAHRVGRLVLGSTSCEAIECVTVVLPEDAGARFESSDPRIVVARLHGAAHRLTMIDVSPAQALRELLSITRDHGLITEAAVSALRGWGAGATKAWQTPEVAELLIRAAAETSSASGAARLSRVRDERRREVS